MLISAPFERFEKRHTVDARGFEEPSVSGLPGHRSGFRRALRSPRQGHGVGSGQNGRPPVAEVSRHEQIHSVRDSPRKFLNSRLNSLCRFTSSVLTRYSHQPAQKQMT